MHPGSAAGQPKSSSADLAKSELRAELRVARAARLPHPDLETARTIRALAACSSAAIVAAYVSVPGEPETAELIGALWESGVQVLLPVLSTSPDWAWYGGDEQLRPGPLGIRQPTGPRLGAEALGAANWIWLPGLAGTPSGQRLGTGGGWYDRALVHADSAATRGLLLHDSEVLAEVPTDAWDQPVDLLVTELRRIDCSVGISGPVSRL